MSSLETLFCHVDDFCTSFESKWHEKLLSGSLKAHKRSRSLVLSEIMTILITFRQNYYRNFKHYYLDHVCVYWREAFPKLPSYQRFALMDALDFNPPMRLFETLFRDLYWH
jgi:hypothetical protein